MDFIPFNSPGNGTKNNSPLTLKKSQTYSNGTTPNSHSKSFSKPSFGSPASFPSFGSPALSFGSPAVQNTSFSPSLRQPSPRNFHQSTPRHNFQRDFAKEGFRPRNGSPSPRHAYSQNSFQYTPPYLAKRPYQNNGNFSKESSDFKTPQQCYSPRGRGNGRKSFTRQFNQVIVHNKLCSTVINEIDMKLSRSQSPNMTFKPAPRELNSSNIFSNYTTASF